MGYNPYRKANGEFATKEEAGAQVENDYAAAVASGDATQIAEIEEYVVNNMDTSPLGQKILEKKFGDTNKIRKISEKSLDPDELRETVRIYRDHSTSKDEREIIIKYWKMNGIKNHIAAGMRAAELSRELDNSPVEDTATVEETVPTVKKVDESQFYSSLPSAEKAKLLSDWTSSNMDKINEAFHKEGYDDYDISLANGAIEDNTHPRLLKRTIRETFDNGGSPSECLVNFEVALQEERMKNALQEHEKELAAKEAEIDNENLLSDEEILYGEVKDDEEVVVPKKFDEAAKMSAIDNLEKTYKNSIRVQSDLNNFRRAAMKAKTSEEVSKIYKDLAEEQLRYRDFNDMFD